MKALNKDIDRISTKGHFHFVLRKIGGNVKNENTRPPSNSKKGTKGRLSNSQKAE